MTKTTLYSVSFAGLGIMFIAISIPLILDRVPPNSTYGFRTAKTLSDPQIWYAANRVAGHDLLIAGLVIALGSVAMLFLGQRLQPLHVTMTLLLLMIFALIGAAVHGFIVVNRM